MAGYVDTGELSTTSTIPILIDTTSTIGAAVVFPATSTLGAAVTIPTTSTIISKYGGVDYTPIHTQKTVNVVTGTLIWTAASGKTINLTDLILSCSTANTVTVTVDTSTVGPFYFASYGGAVSNFKTQIVSASTTASLRLTTTAGTTSITAEGWES